MAQRRPLDGMKDVHRNGVGGDLLQRKRELHELLVRLAHSEDAAAADLEAEPLRGLERRQLVRRRVGGIHGHPGANGRNDGVAHGVTRA